MGLKVKTPTDSPATQQRRWDETPTGRRNDDRAPDDQPGLFAGGIVVDGGQMVESGDLQKPERLELEQVAAMAVSSWRLVGGDDPGPAIARVEVPDAPPNRRWRRAVTFDGDVAFVAFVEPELSMEEFTAVGRQRLKQRGHAPRKQGGV